MATSWQQNARALMVANGKRSYRETVKKGIYSTRYVAVWSVIGRYETSDHLVWDQRVGSSNLSAPTNKIKDLPHRKYSEPSSKDVSDNP